LQRGARLRALDGDLARSGRWSIPPGVEAVVRADVLEILLLVGGVDAQEEMVVGHFVDQDVVHEPAVLVEQAGIMRLADL
jgi:hypothetical protein